MAEGTVKYFNNSKGFGFIKPDKSDEDIFVHRSGLVHEIKENDRVRFKTEHSAKGLTAVKVELIE